MPKEVVLFRDSREKAEPKRNKKETDGESRTSSYRDVKKAKKNISKRDADKRAGYKHAQRIERLEASSKQKKQDDAIKKLQKGNLDLNKRREKILEAV